MPAKPPGILTKTLLIVSTVVCVLTLASMGVSYHLVTQKFHRLEVDEMRLNLERVANEIDNSLTKLTASVADWAPWDESYDFVARVNSDFIDRNLSDDSMQTLGLHCMLFFDTNGHLVYSRFHDLDQQQATVPDTGVVYALRSLPEFFRFSSTKERKSGFLFSSTTPVLVAAAPIVTSTYEGPVRGTLVFSHYLDQSTIDRISEQTKLHVELLPYSPQLQALFAKGSTGQAASETIDPRIGVEVLDANRLRGFLLLNDLHQQPSLVFAVTQERTIYQQGWAMWLEHTLSMTVLGAVFILALVLFFNRIILGRLTQMGQQVGRIAQTGDHDLRVEISGHDEIGDLAGRINTMLDSLQHLQRLQVESEQHLQSIIDSVNCGIMLVDTLDRRIVSINRAGAQIAGRSPDEIIGRLCHQFICPRDMHRCPVLDDGEAIDLSERALLHADGRLIPLLKSVARIEREGASLLVESFIDISELKQAQADLSASEVKYRQFFEDDLTGNFISSRDGQLIDCNPAFALLLGYESPTEIIGKNMQDHYLQPENRRLLLERLQQKRRLDRYEGALRHRNGELVYIICNLIGDFDDQGELVQIRGFIFDDTKRVLLEKEIRQAQKMEAIGTMAGGIAHDFNNILAGIIGYAELVLRDIDEESHPGTCRNLRNILSAGERARSLIEKILTFSRHSEGERRPINLAQTLEEVLQLIRASLPSTIALERQVLGPATVMADPIQMHQVFMNLCTNAGHAMREQGGTLSIILDSVHLDADFTAPYPDLTIGDYARIRISDTGKGIPSQLLERIFDPFFTTKKKGEGTGLGLSMVHGIVAAMRGLILVDSAPGLGTTFTLYLPSTEEQASMTRLEQPAIPTGHEHVVYVDDEGFLVDIGTEILRGLGYQVTGFTDSQEALEYLRSHLVEVDLVVSDMTMPRLTGIELARELRTLSNPPPMLICTGHNEGLTRTDVAPLGIHALLMKPVTVNKLAEAVRSVLESHRHG